VTDAPRQPEKIILDCDPGHDDAVAMLLAHGNPDIELLAVTTVVGNQTLPKVTRNALAVARIAGITGVPFAAGAARPILRPIEVAPAIHGESGLDGPTLPEPSFELDERHAVDLIIDTVMAHEPGTVTLVPTGGLTNIALAARKEPRIVERVKQVVLMGGGVHVGNWSPVAEFNIVIDPEAASIVFDAGWDVVMVGLDRPTRPSPRRRSPRASPPSAPVPRPSSGSSSTSSARPTGTRRASTPRRCTTPAPWPT
jgi:purine nucleosidase